jgi:hypothetical protein
LREYVHRFPRRLNDAILRELPAGEPRPRPEIRWIFPPEPGNGRENPDRGLPAQLGLPPDLSADWSRLGPCWDALGLLTPARDAEAEILLLDARSRIDELEGYGCAVDVAALPAVLALLDQTRAWLGADDTPAWLGPLYRQANRLAHMHLLRNRLGRRAWLVQLYFLNAWLGPASRAEWRPVIAGIHARLGLPRRPPHSLEIFLPAVNSD